MEKGGIELQYKYGTYGYIAKRDLENAVKCLKSEMPNLAIFSAQQAMEKLLKHYLSETYVGIDKTDIMRSHKLSLLANKTGISGLKQYRDCLNTISNYYFDGRYPGSDYEEVSAEEAAELVGIAQDLFVLVEKKIASITLKKMSFFDD